MNQEQLWYDSAEEAVNAAIVKSGMKPAQVAYALWPGMKMDSAYARLKNALRADKAEKLTLDEIIQVCRITGYYDPLYYMADELSHGRPQPRSPEDEEASLANEAAKLAQSVQQLMKRFDYIEHRKQQVRGQ